ncbi:MAG: TIGR01777 family oxidoreductase [Bacteroidetes bacterium]|nr:TIGR01777 family oxidoreductase [Bacteroidota bacterium]
MLKVLISGGTGLVGKHLSEKLRKKGYAVAVLSRTSKKDVDIPTYSWDIEKKEIDQEAIETADCIIHLAGASIAEKRWTAKRKQLIIDSRVKSGQLIFDKVKENKNQLKVFISASAIGYYGAITSNKIFTETDPPANDFLGETCKQWEGIIDKFEELGIRTVKIRTGVVLSEQGGALEKMTKPIKIGIGSALGSGKQYIPWIHIDDLCGIYIKAIEDSQMRGAYNAVAPDHKSNIGFIRILARVLKKPIWLPSVPSMVLKILFGSMSAIILKGSRVSSEKIKAAGYNFLFPDLERALIDLCRKN